MLTICPYFHVHQPFRIKRYRIFDIGNDHEYFNDESGTDLDNRWIMNKVAEKSYIPTTEVLQELLDRHPDFRFALSFSGVVLDQMEEYAPDVLDRFKRLVDSGRVELLADTYHHSLAFFYFEKYHQLKDSIYNTNNLKAIEELNAKYQAAQNEQTIASSLWWSRPNRPLGYSDADSVSE